MRSLHRNLLVLQALAIFLVLFGSGVTAAQPIEPTRTLDDAEKKSGLLSVFSEPPELPVVVDGKDMGNTPLINMRLEAGDHRITIGGEKVPIYISAEKPVRLSYFKGRIVEIAGKPEQAQSTDRPSDSAVHRPAAKQPEKKEQPQSPFYWPLNPTGPIY